MKPEIIASEVERRRTSHSPEFDLSAITQRIAAIDRQRKNLVRTFAFIDNDEDSAALVAQELSTLTSLRNELESEHQRKAAQFADWGRERQRLNDLITWCSRAATNLSQLSYQERRSVLDALGVQVQVWMSDHDPRWELEMAPLPVSPDLSIVYGTKPG